MSTQRDSRSGSLQRLVRRGSPELKKAIGEWIKVRRKADKMEMRLNELRSEQGRLNFEAGKLLGIKPSNIEDRERIEAEKVRAVVLRGQGKTLKEIAETIGISVTAAANRLKQWKKTHGSIEAPNEKAQQPRARK